jgi:hypothetical protein
VDNSGHMPRSILNAISAWYNMGDLGEALKTEGTL